MTAHAQSRRLDLPLLQSLIDALPDPCLVIDRDCTVIAVNPTWDELTRQRFNSATGSFTSVGSNYFAISRSTSTERGMAEVRAGIESVLSGSSQNFEQEYLFHNQDTFRWYRTMVRPWPLLGARAVIFHREITAEKFDKTRPQELDQEFRLLADAAPVLIWISGPDKGCTFLNQPWLDFTGVPIEQQLGDGWLRLIHPEDRQRIFQDYVQAFDEKRNFEFEFRLLHKDGGYRWIRDRGSPRFDSQNQVTGFVGSAWDLSDQKQATETAYKATRQTRLEHTVGLIASSATTVREALEGSIDTICEVLHFSIGRALLIYDDEPESDKSPHVFRVSDPDRFAHFVALSESMCWPPDPAERLLVLQSGKPVIMDPLTDYAQPDIYPRVSEAIRAGLHASVMVPVLVDDKVEAILEFASEKPFASDRELLATLMAACERLSRFFERRRAQTRFLKQKEELQASAQQLFTVAGRLVDSQEQERRRIAREIHDDFSQRLALVSMKIESLAGRDRDVTFGELNADFEDVRNSIASVAEDLQGLSRQLHPARLELLGLVRALRAHCSDFYRNSGIATTFEASVLDDDATPQTATCLYRVLQESLANIAKHSGSSTARVTLDRRNGHFEMCIRDEGRGFVRCADTSKGIGLISMKERVGLLNGKMIVNSGPGRGTEILVQVPVAVQVSPEHPQH
jgi:PAS domain S-box-containing protein